MSMCIYVGMCIIIDTLYCYGAHWAGEDGATATSIRMYRVAVPRIDGEYVCCMCM
jgi:hypothetical protein